MITNYMNLNYDILLLRNFNLKKKRVTVFYFLPTFTFYYFSAFDLQLLNQQNKGTIDFTSDTIGDFQPSSFNTNNNELQQMPGWSFVYFFLTLKVILSRFILCLVHHQLENKN